MSTGYDGDVDNLECAKPPDGGDRPNRWSAGCGRVIPAQAYFLDEYKPNCFFWGPNTHLTAILANCTSGTNYANVPGGTGQTDLCLETWMLFRLGPAYTWTATIAGADQPPIFAVATNLVTGPATGTGFGFCHYGGTFRARFVENLNVVEVVGAITAGWHHVAINCARGGNLELFIDGVSQGTAAGVTNYTFANGNFTQGLSADHDRGGWTGPLALHARVLTGAEINASFVGKTVQANAQTEWAYDPRDLVLTPRADLIDTVTWRWIDNVNTAAWSLPNWSSWLGFWSANITVGLEELDNLYILMCECSSQCPVAYIPDRSANARTLMIRNQQALSAQTVFSSHPFWT